jgi:hypothetical protein
LSARRWTSQPGQSKSGFPFQPVHSRFQNDCGQGLEFGFAQLATEAINPARDEEKAVRRNRSRQGRHARNYNLER